MEPSERHSSQENASNEEHFTCFAWMQSTATVLQAAIAFRLAIAGLIVTAKLRD